MVRKVKDTERKDSEGKDPERKGTERKDIERKDKGVEATAEDPAGKKGGLFDRDLASQVKDSAQQIWLAGMGAFAKVHAEGRQVFESLVKEGSTLQKKTQSSAEERLGAATEKISDLAGDVSATAGRQWDRLESIFEERTAKALNRLRVPSAKQVAELTARIEELSATVARLSAVSPKAAKRASERPPGKKAAAPKRAAPAGGAPRPSAKRTAAKRTAPKRPAAKRSTPP